MESVKELRVRYWIYLDGNKFFGLGRAQLLKHIEESGSIANAAKAMGMSYKKAWAMVDDMNSRAQEPYVIAKKGGKSGGGTELTDAGRKMLGAYDNLNKKLASIAESEMEILSLI
ncbi:winged helix-turn-helix domain-containing protein [Dyadobacter frigoris]|uniref:LysR family transcriptional regulator n=1 Tax=Dyadobacter frigoris TaxID=2576211 RepID=A0A4U6DBP0_9BACT|nr:LysR family transcriptional regulator [Dyadobacter frigoris]TKT93638.1 LysR family transcriptional regulator [Dyadobacter frigoris]GLU51155.1 ModE family transcriptional regulator [Dyadobacter frigoris]